MAEAGRQVPIIAKLEKPEAIARLDAILEKTDGVMVARGDLGVEIPPEEVPAIQKDIIRRANLRGLPVIVATQMLNSMIEHPAAHPRRGLRRGERGLRRRGRADALRRDGLGQLPGRVGADDGAHHPRRRERGPRPTARRRRASAG